MWHFPSTKLSGDITSRIVEGSKTAWVAHPVPCCKIKWHAADTKHLKTLDLLQCLLKYSFWRSNMCAHRSYYQLKTLLISHLSSLHASILRSDATLKKYLTEVWFSFDLHEFLTYFYWSWPSCYFQRCTEMRTIPCMLPIFILPENGDNFFLLGQLQGADHRPAWGF